VRLTFLLPGYPWHPVGGFRVVYEYASGLAARGHQVTVLHPRRIEGVERPPPEGLRRRALRPLGDLRFALRQRLTRPDLWWQEVHPDVELRYIGEPRPADFPDADVVFATAWQTVPYVEALPPAAGRKHYLVMDFPPYLGPADLIHDSWRRPLTKIAISTWLEDQVRAAGAHDVHTIPIGISQPFHAPKSMSMSMSMSTSMSVSMLLSRAPYKAWHDGLDAIRLARQQVRSLHADLYGPGPAPEGLEPWIRYHRNIETPDLVALFDRSAVVLCSSLAEGFALPPAEAALRGCAIVTTDCGGNRDYAVHEETALVSPPGRPADLARNLIRALEDPDLRRRLAYHARARLAPFTWPAATEALEAITQGRSERGDPGD
jgi:glycosyltransferase involved in cell wall biosynthesis